jgi:hypothetical protein
VFSLKKAKNLAVKTFHINISGIRHLAIKAVVNPEKRKEM